jgi:hypothetical protein
MTQTEQNNSIIKTPTISYKVPKDLGCSCACGQHCGHSCMTDDCDCNECRCIECLDNVYQANNNLNRKSPVR